MSVLDFDCRELVIMIILVYGNTTVVWYQLG